VYAGQHHLGEAAGVQRRHLADQLVHGAAALGAARHRDGAEGAAVPAPILNLHEGPRALLGEQMLAPRLLCQRRQTRTVQLLQALHEGVLARVGYHQIHPGQRRGPLRLQRRHAAGEHQPSLRRAAMQPGGGLAGLARGLGGHRAGVENDDVCRRGVGDDGMPPSPELAGPARALGLVEAAAQEREVDVHDKLSGELWRRARVT